MLLAGRVADAARNDQARARRGELRAVSSAGTGHSVDARLLALAAIWDVCIAWRVALRWIVHGGPGLLGEDSKPAV